MQELLVRHVDLLACPQCRGHLEVERPVTRFPPVVRVWAAAWMALCSS